MGGVGVGDDSKVGRDDEVDNEIDNEVDDKVDNKVDDEFDNEDEVRKKGRNLSKSKKTESGFLTSGVRMAFI